MVSESNFFYNHAVKRRKFIAALTKAVGSTVFLSAPMVSLAGSFFSVKDSRTVGQIMDLFIKEVPGAPFENTVDTLKAGSRDTAVTGIVTTMFPTLEVIQKAIVLKANFIIAHEPTFYNHLDETDWLQNDDVYRFKADLLKKHNVAIWRNHDYIHRFVPDGVRTGVVAQLGWGKYYEAKHPNMLIMPAVTLKALIQQVKEKLKINTVRYIGDLSQTCGKILLMPGAAGGKRQIEALRKEQPDVLLCGEIQEWETAEYVRDARTKGQKLTLIVMGHAVSEEPGAEFMATWLKAKLPAIPVTHLSSHNPLSYL